MKILIYTDNHFCEAHSIIQKYGTKYTQRIENQLASLNWVEQLAQQHDCGAEICLGDFFNSASLTDQEITAVKDIEWNAINKYFLVGNHESGEVSLEYSSTKVLEADTRHIISEPKFTIQGNCELCFLPYISESVREPLKSYFPEKTRKYRVIFSHNDLRGVQMGPVVSKLGFSQEEIIEAGCDLFVNGHIHNQQEVWPNVLNLGNLTGQNFSEDASKYAHTAMILDTDTLKYELIENPYALNFYKLEISTEDDIAHTMDKLKTNAVLSIKCVDTCIDTLRKCLTTLNDKILESRIITIKNLDTSAEAGIRDLSELTVDHLAKFVECCRLNLDNSEILEAELTEVCK